MRGDARQPTGAPWNRRPIGSAPLPPAAARRDGGKGQLPFAFVPTRHIFSRSLAAHVVVERTLGAEVLRHSALFHKTRDAAGSLVPTSPSLRDARIRALRRITLGATTLGTATLGATTLGTATLGTATLGTATLGTATLGTATLGTATLGTATGRDTGYSLHEGRRLRRARQTRCLLTGGRPRTWLCGDE